MGANCSHFDIGFGFGFGLNLQDMLDRLAQSFPLEADRVDDQVAPCWPWLLGANKPQTRLEAALERRCGEKLEMLGSPGANQRISMTPSRTYLLATTTLKALRLTQQRRLPGTFLAKDFRTRTRSSPVTAAHFCLRCPSSCNFFCRRGLHDGASSGYDCSTVLLKEYIHLPVFSYLLSSSSILCERY